MYMPSIHKLTEYDGGLEKLASICNTYLVLMKEKNASLYLHAHQTANYAAGIATRLKLPADEINNINFAALLHDIGQLAIPNSVLYKAPFLTTRELAAYKNHCNCGCAMLENIAACQTIIPFIKHHHEQWNGGGYPKRLKGLNIPLGARIITVANFFDHFINPCVQNWSKTKKDAIIELSNHSGTLFDPTVVKAFISILVKQYATAKLLSLIVFLASMGQS